MDSNNQRLFLNFGNNNPNDRLAASDRAYPTTPSTFPQPVFPPSASGQQIQSPQQAYGGGYGQQQQGYFVQNQYAQQQQQQQQYQGQQVNDYQGGYQQRSNTPGTNDPNTGLAHQFSHQNLGGAARAQGYGRGPTAQRPRTAGATGQQPAYGGYMNAPPLPTQSAVPVNEFAQAPERNPDRYGTNSNSNQKKCSQLAADFFKDSVKRARERNQRYGASISFWLKG